MNILQIALRTFTIEQIQKSTNIKQMNILIYGAGIIGCIYAARLFEAGHNVTLLARRQKYEDIKRAGIKIQDAVTGNESMVKVPVVIKLNPSDSYDLIIVTVRLDQLQNVIADLHGNNASSQVLFMQNNPDGTEMLKKDLPNKHLFLGFPGVGGISINERIDYVQIKQQKTTIGEIDGNTSETITDLKSIFDSAGFKTEISFKMQDWLKTHALFIACISASIVNAKGDSVILANSKSGIRTMVQSIREGFIALESLKITIEPRNLKTIFMTMPLWFSILYWKKAMRSNLGTLAIAPHTMAATEEMQLVAEKIMATVDTSPISTPTLKNLLNTFIGHKSK